MLHLCVAERQVEDHRVVGGNADILPNNSVCNPKKIFITLSLYLILMINRCSVFPKI